MTRGFHRFPLRACASKTGFYFTCLVRTVFLFFFLFFFLFAGFFFCHWFGAPLASETNGERIGGLAASFLAYESIMNAAAFFFFNGTALFFVCVCVFNWTGPSSFFSLVNREIPVVLS